MKIGRLPDGCLDAQPIADRRNFAEGNAGLDHAERAGVHAEKDDPLGTAAEPAQIFLVRGPGVGERIVNVRDRRREFQATDLVGKFAGGGDKLGMGGRGQGRKRIRIPGGGDRIILK